MKKILITGATGGLGSAVADFLKVKKTGHDIAVLVRDPDSEKANDLKKAGFEILVADYSNQNALLKAFDGVDVLYFVSGSDMMNRHTQHENVVKAANDSSVEHIFYTSVSLNDLPPESPLYPAMKIHLDTEKWISETDLNYTFLRHNLYGEVIPMFLGSKEQVLGSKMVYLPTGNGKTAFVPRVELAEAGANALAQPEIHANKIYELNGSSKSSFSQVADRLSEITGESINFVSPEVDEFENTLKSHNVPEEYIGMMSVFSAGIKAGAFDSPRSDLQSLLGRESLPMSDFLDKIYS